MNVICDANQEIFNILKGPQIYVEGKKYRFNKFCIIEEYEDKRIIKVKACKNNDIEESKEEKEDK